MEEFLETRSCPTSSYTHWWKSWITQLPMDRYHSLQVSWTWCIVVLIIHHLTSLGGVLCCYCIQEACWKYLKHTTAKQSGKTWQLKLGVNPLMVLEFLFFWPWTPAIKYTVFDQLKQRCLKRNQNVTEKGSSPETLSALSIFMLGVMSKSIVSNLVWGHDSSSRLKWWWSQQSSIEIP